MLGGPALNELLLRRKFAFADRELGRPNDTVHSGRFGELR
jgi:hypothetical protein